MKIVLEHRKYGWTFTPVGDNGEPLAQSEVYKSKWNAKRAAKKLFAGQYIYFVKE